MLVMRVYLPGNRPTTAILSGSKIRGFVPTARPRIGRCCGLLRIPASPAQKCSGLGCNRCWKWYAAASATLSWFGNLTGSPGRRKILCTCWRTFFSPMAAGSFPCWKISILPRRSAGRWLVFSRYLPSLNVNNLRSARPSAAWVGKGRAIPRRRLCANRL